jgi:hypothetical protein
MHKKYYLLFLFFFIFNMVVYAQKVDYQDIGIDKQEKKIYIPYTIKDSPKYNNLYGIELYYTQDKGKSYIGPLQQVTGDVGKNIEPGEKLIVWDYHTEDPTFNGQDTQFKLQVTYRPNPNFLGGPANALYSVVVPGWGDTKVWQKPKYWYVNTIAAWGLIGGGLYMRSKSNQTKEEYLESSTANQAQDLFKKSNNQKVIGSSLILAGVAVWVTDITRVALKGFKNRKEVKKLKEEQNQQPKTTWQFQLDQIQQQTTVGIILKF